jgi:hypothetical protein
MHFRITPMGCHVSSNTIDILVQFLFYTINFPIQSIKQKSSMCVLGV